MISHQQITRVPTYPCIRQHLALPVFLIIASQVEAEWHVIVVLMHIFLMTMMFFMCLFNYFCIFFGDITWNLLPIFNLGCLSSYHWVVSVLYTCWVYTTLLSNTWLVSIFFWSVACLFIFRNEVQWFLMLMRWKHFKFW